jgi:hypothetical protein
VAGSRPRVWYTRLGGGCAARESHAQNSWRRVGARADVYGADSSCSGMSGPSSNELCRNEGKQIHVAAGGEAAVAERPELRAAREGA